MSLINAGAMLAAASPPLSVTLLLAAAAFAVGFALRRRDDWR